MHKARFYVKKGNDIVNCTLCSHKCIIKEGMTGVCGVRRNLGGSLYSLVYERVAAMNNDPIEKKPLFHFLPGSKVFSIGTVGCNLRCSFCQNNTLSQASKGQKARIYGEKMSCAEIVDMALKFGSKSIAYTYNEPVIFAEMIIDTAKIARKAGLKNVMVSNGYFPKETLEELSKYIDAINFDLKSSEDFFYKKLCGAGSVKPVMENIMKAKELGIWVEVTTLVIPGENDTEETLNKIAHFIVSVDKDIPWHISRFFPYHKMLETPVTPETTLVKAFNIGKKAGLEYIYVGNLHHRHEYENTKCSACGELAVRRSGYHTEDLTDKGKCRKCKHLIAGIFQD
ncbi:AmmeMemoRadiSam system radical SAM enzyme [Candidatus Woesearchaeota archaeon]|nr:AmmeMemoRadiSam system radical SAM enzyme [Candidatus Woesearchaeota archaeon]